MNIKLLLVVERIFWHIMGWTFHWQAIKQVFLLVWHADPFKGSACQTSVSLCSIVTYPVYTSITM